MFLPDIQGVLSIADRISKEAKNNGALVSIESTIPMGTSEKVLEILDHRLHVVHAPHRWYAFEEKEHGVNQLRVIGGVYGCCLREDMHFYNNQRPVENMNFNGTISTDVASLEVSHQKRNQIG